MSYSSVNKRLEQVYQTAETLPFSSSSKIVIMSDCHRGQGNTGDNFLQNQNIFFGALELYYQKGFTYIELGDGDELWENRKIEAIEQMHSDAFWLMSKFYKHNRFYMLYGNHDIVKSRKSFMQKHCESYYCESSHRFQSLFPNIEVHQGLVLQNSETGQEILLVHGHQGDLLNDTLWPLARFLVRYVWRPLETIGFLAPTGAGRAHKSKDKVERKLASYASAQKRILIAGHTHRPQFPASGEGYYFNDGSCVHPRCITAIEIQNNQITLVKWAVTTKKDRSLFIGRHVLEGPTDLSEYFTLD